MSTEETLLNRDMYRKIKAYNKDEMQAFINRTYEIGRRAAFEKIDFDRLWTDIAAIKGIGEVKLSQIMAAIERALNIEIID